MSSKLNRRTFMKQSAIAAVAAGATQSAPSQAHSTDPNPLIQLDDIESVNDPRLTALVAELEGKGYAVYFEPEDVAHLRPGDVMMYDFENAMSQKVWRGGYEVSQEEFDDADIVNAARLPWRDFDASSPAHVVKSIYSVDHRHREFFWAPTVAVMLVAGETPVHPGLEEGVKELRIFNPEHLKKV